MGRTRVTGDVSRPFPDSGAATDRVLGTYLHGLFENEPVRQAFLRSVRGEKAVTPVGSDAPSSYDAAADLLRDHVDLGPLSLPKRRHEGL